MNPTAQMQVVVMHTNNYMVNDWQAWQQMKQKIVNADKAGIDGVSRDATQRKQMMRSRFDGC